MENDNIQKEEKKVEEKKKEKDLDHILEILVVVMLGITALLTAWASWIGALHGGNQATNYTESNNFASEGNSEYNAGIQGMMQDMLLWNEISDLQIDIFFAQENNDPITLEQTTNKLYFKLNDNLSDDMAATIGWSLDHELGDPTEIILSWLEKEEALVSPFTIDGFIEKYFESANTLLAESSAKLEEGQKSNAYSDAFGLVTVIFGVVLFLLGIAGTIKSQKNRIVVISISTFSLVIATIYMFTLPLPAGFNIMSFFGQG